MKIKSIPLDYERVISLKKEKHKYPRRPSRLFHTLIRVLSLPDLWTTHFKATKIGMEKLKRNEPCLILMNHSSFLDLKIASAILYPRPFHIVSTSDAFVGKRWLMKTIGCIPTKKFIPDFTLVRDLLFALKKSKSSVLMFPEAGYSFDGTGIVLPESLGRCLKLLDVPVVMIRTSGAFARDPLYNNLQLRKVPVSAEVKYLLSPEEIKEKSPKELNEILKNEFTFDGFRWQQENNIRIGEPFRADCLHRVLYKCPHCLAEGMMLGKGTTLTCQSCGKAYELTEYGYLKATESETEFSHVPDWYQWQRECVREELLSGTYRMEIPVEIRMLVDTRALYEVGSGTLVHSGEGFRLEGCDGKLSYEQRPLASYSLNADYFWYEIGDVISIGTLDALYYCFPKDAKFPVSKARLATEELYKLVKENKFSEIIKE